MSAYSLSRAKALELAVELAKGNDYLFTAEDAVRDARKFEEYLTKAD